MFILEDLNTSSLLRKKSYIAWLNSKVQFEDLDWLRHSCRIYFNSFIHSFNWEDTVWYKDEISLIVADIIPN